MQPRCGAYLLTWTTYATWMPGDDRGFVSAVPDSRGRLVIHNSVGAPFDRSMPLVKQRAIARQKGERVILSATHARTCEAAFRETADRFDIHILAGAIMATHVHLVVRSIDADGARLLNLFIGASSRRLSLEFPGQPAGWWTRRGSRRLLTDDASLSGAVIYVRRQERPRRIFEHAPRDRRSAT